MVAAPAVRIAVLNILFGQQSPGVFQDLDDQRIRLPDCFPEEFLR
jgi:hypothetical protein